jgi:hypothetical protein
MFSVKNAMKEIKPTKIKMARELVRNGRIKRLVKREKTTESLSFV